MAGETLIIPRTFSIHSARSSSSSSSEAISVTFYSIITAKQSQKNVCFQHVTQHFSKGLVREVLSQRLQLRRTRAPHSRRLCYLPPTATPNVTLTPKKCTLFLMHSWVLSESQTSFCSVLSVGNASSIPMSLQICVAEKTGFLNVGKLQKARLCV